MKDTIILDLRKVSDENGFNNAKDLFEEIHTNTEKENHLLEADLARSKIIIDNEGIIIECNNIQEFLDNSQSLTKDQQQYILNMGHQGLFGGGSALIPVSNTIMNTSGIQDVMLFDTRNSQQSAASNEDVPLCVSIKGTDVTLTNTINFKISNIHTMETYGNTTLSLVADLSNIEKGKEKELPIYMVVSQENKEKDIIGAIREVQGHAEEQDKGKVDDLINSIQKVRDNKNQYILDNKNLIYDHNMITEIARESLNKEKDLEHRQKELNSKIHTSCIKIPATNTELTYTIPEMAAKIYHRLTNSLQDTQDKKAMRMQFGAQKVVEYITSFEGKNAAQGKKPSIEIVTNILSSLVDKDEKAQKKIIQKSAPIILRQVTDSKYLSYIDRVKKVFDTISIAIMFDGKDVKNMVQTVKSTKAASPTFVERLAATSPSRSQGSLRGK